MDHVFLGSSGVRVSSLCLGTMSFGGEADDGESGRIFARAREVGINFFDTADVYNHGRSEQILGRLVASCRDEVVIATKAYFPTSKDPNARGSSRYHLVRAVEASLRRLGTDRIDVFYLHRFDEQTNLEDSLRTLEMLIQQGKILYPAASNFSAWQVARAIGIGERMGWAPIVCAQPMYNLAKRQAEVEILPMARALGLGVCSYSPLGGGLLSGKYATGARPSDGRLVANKMYATRYGAESNYELARAFTALAAERGVHPVSLAIAWVRANPGITAPIIGARNVAQLEPALASIDLEMTPTLYAEVGALSAAPPPATDRNEESSTFNFGRR